MSGITSSVGLVSGLPTQDIIDQLIALESRPMLLLQNRVGNLQTQRTAYVDLSARLLSLKSIAARFDESQFFNAFKTNSSDESVLTATADATARPGSYSFRVHSLVANHQLIAGGLADPDSTPVGAGTLTVEIGHGRLDPGTSLDVFNGGEGIRRGKISITDRSGARAEIDLTTALTVDDVLDAINSQTVADVRASVSGDSLVIEDLTGETVGPLTVSDVGRGHAAEDLGIAGTDNDADGRIEGADVVNLVDSSLLRTLNDGNGVRHHRAGDDFSVTMAGGPSFTVSLDGFLGDTTHLDQLNNGNGVRLGTVRITDRSGASAEVDLSSAETIQDVIDAFNATDVGVRVSRVSSHLQILDETGTSDEDAVNLKVEDVSGYAARDLGLAADTEEDSFSGSDIYRVTTVGDVVRAINYADGNRVDGTPQIVASISADGNGITLTPQGGATGDVTIEALDNADGVFSQAAADLGLEGTFTGEVVSRDLIAGLNTVLLHSLQGGAGIDLTGIQTTARDGTVYTYTNLSDARTVQDLIDRINEMTDQSKVSARINPAGNGIEIVDESGATSGLLSVADVGGTTAADLGLDVQVDEASITGANLQLRYVSESTRLDEVNYGDGVRTGQFRITNGLGAAFTFNVTQSQTRVGDVLDLINARASTSRVTASINPNGDGILLTDASGGTERLRVDDVNGGAAADLHLVGEAGDGANTIDGSYEIQIDVAADDTLNDVVSKINDAGAAISASVVNDGSVTNPYRLVLSSDVSGRRGRLMFDAGDTGLEMDTLVQARDAVIFLGDTETENPLVISSPTNTLNNVVPGVSIELVGTSDDPVTLSINQDLDKIISDLKLFVTNFNAVQDRIDQYTSFDPETEERGTLLGESTVNRIRDRMYRALLAPFSAGSEDLNRLSDLGFSVADGARLEFDEEKFRDVYANNPDAVETLFTAKDNGIGAVLNDLLDEVTRSDDGLIARRDATLERQEQDLNDRIAAMQILLDGRRSHLEHQFQALETALSQLQSQQNALSALSALTG